MGVFDPQAGTSSNPAKLYLTWTPEYGKFTMAGELNGVKYDGWCTAIKSAVVLNPNCERITGGVSKVYKLSSNLASPKQKDLRVVKYDFATKRKTVIGKGKWENPTFKALIKGLEGHWTKVIMVYLGSVEYTNNQDQKFLVDAKCVAEIRLKGYAIMKGWDNSIKEAGYASSWGMDGFKFKVIRTNRSLNEKNGKEYDYPFFEGSMLDPEKDQATIEKLKPYFEEIAVYLQSDLEDIEQAPERIEPVQQETPSFTEDEDLPF